MEPFHDEGKAEGSYAPADRDSSVMRVIGEEDLHGRGTIVQLSFISGGTECALVSFHDTCSCS